MSRKKQDTDSLNYQAAEQIFQSAILKAPQDREAFLLEACTGNARLHAYLKDLIRLHFSEAELPTELIADDIHATIESTHDGMLINQDYGAYRLIKKLAEGGMGAVYAAERADKQYRKQVAIKIIRQRHDPAMQAWFLNERQILANLEHPNICRLLDGNTDSDGHPFLVMEFVEGKTLTEYCDQHACTIEQRLKLFLVLCDAVAYAHQKLIVHRDIKPSNILVTPEGHIKLMDFGIAELLSTGQTDQAAKPSQPLPVSTAYASPEQLTGKPVSVQHDVYSLGVVLHRLLCGVLPQRGPDNAEISSIETIVTPEHAANCSSPLQAIKRKLNADVQHILKTSLAWNNLNRYQSVAELTGDIRAYLNDRPLKDNPGPWIFRTGKYIKRHTVAIGITALLLFAATAILTTVIAFNIQLSQQRETALAERDKAQAATRFLTSIFESADPTHALGADITARQLLDIGAVQASQTAGQSPELQTAMLQTMGIAYRSLGLFEESEDYLSEAKRLSQSIYAPGSLELAEINTELADLYILMGRGEQARELISASLPANRELLGDNHVAVARNLAQLSNINHNEANFERAEQQVRDALNISLHFDTDQYLIRAEYLIFLSTIQQNTARFSEAVATLQQVLSMFQQQGLSVHPLRATALQHLGIMQRSNGDYASAEDYFNEALDIRKTIYGDEHPLTAISLNNIGMTLNFKGELQAARPFLEQALEINQQHYGNEHTQTVQAFNNLAYLNLDMGDYAAAEPLFRQALESAYTAWGKDHYNIGIYMTNLSAVLQKQDKFIQACPIAKSALAHLQQRMEPDHWRLAVSRSVLGACLHATDDKQYGIELMAAGYQQLLAEFGDQAIYTIEAQQRLNSAGE